MRLAIRPLTLLVAPRARPFPSSCGAPESLPPPSRQREWLSRSRAPSIDKCLITCLRSQRGPPPFPKLCRLGPASGALSLLAMLSHGGARPSTVVTGYSPVVARTARRLSTSAIVSIHEHNRLIDRTLHTTPESPPAQLFCRWPGPFQSSASRDVTGQGPVWINQNPRLSPRSLAWKASPQPDRLGHLLSRT